MISIKTLISYIEIAAKNQQNYQTAAQIGKKNIPNRKNIHNSSHVMLFVPCSSIFFQDLAPLIFKKTE